MPISARLHRIPLRRRLALTGATLLVTAGLYVGTAPTTSNAQTSAETKTSWSLEANCVSCHTLQADSMENGADCLLATHATMALPVQEGQTAKDPAEKDSQERKGSPKAAQVTAAGEDTGAIGCTSCHNDETALAKRHRDPDPSRLQKLNRLKKTGIDETTCFACHGGYEELAELTAQSTVLTDKEGTVVNPHDVPGLTEGHKDAGCSSCHKMHSADEVETDAAAYCVSCHHENVYECNTCH